MTTRKQPLTSILAHESIKESKQAMYENRSLENIEGEIWLPVIGYEGRYEISNVGRVKSLSRKVHRRNNSIHITKEFIKKQRIVKKGYPTVYLAIGKIYHHKLVHVLVAQHFIPNPLNKPEVNHLFGDKLDSRVESLEWTTKSENITHAYKIGIMCQQGEKHASNKLNNEDVLYIFYSNEKRKILMEKYNVSHGTIGNIKTKKGWTHLTKDLINEKTPNITNVNNSTRFNKTA